MDRNLLLAITLLISIALLSPKTLATAQNYNPKEFYNSDFPAIPDLDNATSDRTNKIIPAVGDRKPEQGTNPKEAPQNNRPSRSATRLLPPDVKISTFVTTGHTASIEVAVNYLDQNHFAAVLDTIRRLAAAKRARITTVYCLGATATALPQELRNEFLRYGIIVGPYNKAPVSIDVARSPVWIFASPSGKVVVEGIMNIERFLSPEGGFQGEVEKPLPAPTSVPTQEE